LRAADAIEPVQRVYPLPNHPKQRKPPDDQDNPSNQKPPPRSDKTFEQMLKDEIEKQKKQ
jgi:hypothetical protein